MSAVLLSNLINFFLLLEFLKKKKSVMRENRGESRVGGGVNERRRQMTPDLRNNLATTF